MLRNFRNIPVTCVRDTPEKREPPTNKDLTNAFNSIENYANTNRRIVRNKVKIIATKFINELF